MNKAAQFLIDHGMTADTIELDTYTEAFYESMLEGLKRKCDTVPMIPTYLRGEKQLPKGKKVAVIDAGGTNFRTSLVWFEHDGVHFDRLEKHSMPGTDEPAKWEDFIAHTAQCVLPLMDEAEAIGFCFSYPAEVTPDRDSRVISMTKQVKLIGAEGRLVGAELMDELERLGVRRKKIIVLNDTPATLLGASAALKKSRFGGFIGLVAGTGVNTCCCLPEKSIEKLGLKGHEKMLINLESGSFKGLPLGDFDLALHESLPDTGCYPYEKMCSGRYLGELCRLTLRAAAEEGIFSETAKEFLLDLKKLESSAADKWGTGRLPKCFSSEDKVNAVYIISNLFERAARCAACNLCAILKLTGEGEERPVCIGVDGSLYKRSRLFKPFLEDSMAVYAGEIMGRKYEFITAEEATIIGSAAAALLN